MYALYETCSFLFTVKLTMKLGKQLVLSERIVIFLRHFEKARLFFVVIRIGTAVNYFHRAIHGSNTSFFTT